MIRVSELKLPLSALPLLERLPLDADKPTKEFAQAPEQVHPLAALRQQASEVLGTASRHIAELTVFKRSFDARRAEVWAVYIVDVRLLDANEEAVLLQRHAQHPHIQATPDMHWQPPVFARECPKTPARPVVVGLGPCGLFVALALAQMGFAPIVLERGPSVRQRTKDTWGLWRQEKLNDDSNVQFGEGGAGLFSDGKLYSQIKDPRHLGRKVMAEFVAAGAPPEILYAAHPHVGTFKLVKVVEQLRERIIALGGEIRFEQRVVELLLDDPPPDRDRTRPSRVRGVRVQNRLNEHISECATPVVVLALGHSSRDTFAMLWDKGVHLDAKPFSIGVRIEHPQSVIDRARWGQHAGHPLLGAADYKLVHHARNGRAVYSFCMCPGGTVVAATSEANRVVTNGMSQYSRNERNANAGLVVGIDPTDYPLDLPSWTAAFGADDGPRYAEQAQNLAQQQCIHPLAGVVLQRQLESKAFEAGGRNYHAPAQRVGDFLAGQASTRLGTVQASYRPGVLPTDLATVLPDFAVQAMREALPVFGRKIKGYDMADAVLTGVETRTSSPLRITRGDDYQSLNVQGLFPAGEGAGYAGGILSAAVDGIKVAEAVAKWLHTHSAQP